MAASSSPCPPLPSLDYLSFIDGGSVGARPRGNHGSGLFQVGLEVWDPKVGLLRKKLRGLYWPKQIHAPDKVAAKLPCLG